MLNCKINMVGEDYSSKVNHHLSNMHNKRYEQITQPSLSNYTIKSDGCYRRKQYFQFGKTSGGSESNKMIYSGGPLTLDMNGIKPKAPIRKYYETPSNSFLYGQDDHIKIHSDPKLSNIISLEERTSAEMRKKQREAKETEQNYIQYMQEKERLVQKRDEEKRKDLDMLKTYKQPWGKPGCGAPKESNHRTRELHRLQDHQEQTFPFGRPGAGAPLRTDSGSVRTGLPSDTEIHFKKRDRNQIHDGIMPLNHKLDRSNQLTTDLDFLAHESRERRNVIKRDKDLSASVYDPFGRPGAGAPLRDNNGKTQTARSMNLMRFAQEPDSSKHKLQDISLPYGTPRFKMPVKEQHVESVDTSSWLKRGTVGQPPYEYDTATHEIFGAPRVTSDIIKQRVETNYQDKERSRLYHEQLDEHSRLMEENRKDELREQREKSVKHAPTMNNIWGKKGYGAPRDDPRRQKVDVSATQLIMPS